MNVNKQLHLVTPSINYAASYLEASSELRATNRRDTDEAQIETREQLEDYIDLLVKNQKGLSLKPGHVRSREFWLVQGEHYIGRIGIRDSWKEDPHMQSTGNIGYLIRPSERKKGYGKLLFQLGMDEARKEGFKELLIVVNKSNQASRSIIQSNGGVLIETSNPTEHNERLRYLIKL